MGWFKKIFKRETFPSAGGSVQGKGEEKKAEKKAGIDVVEKKSAKETGPVKSGDNIAYKILLRPLVTEKSAIAESGGKYSFIIARWATKTQIRNAVESLYGEKPTAINIINVEGRRLNFKRKPGSRSDYKKAIVGLKKGVKIDIHTGV